MKYKNILPIIVFFSIVFFNCPIGYYSYDPFFQSYFGVNSEREFIYKKMKTVYFWKDKTPNVDIDLYNSNQSLLDDLIYKEYDKWSFILTLGEYEQYYQNNEYVGYGILFKWADQAKTDYRIGYVMDDSPAKDAGLSRGDKILKINDKSMDYILQNNLWESVSDEIYNGTSINFQVYSVVDDVARDVSMTKRVINIKSVHMSKIIDINNKKIGYIVYNEFNASQYDNTYSSELAKVFEYFKNNNVNELVVDLRYNGGGRVDVCHYFANLISGAGMSGETFIKMKYNDDCADNNLTLNFKHNVYSLNMTRVFFITTDNTASASEALINGLKPHIEVKIIGGKTHGKPVGMNGFQFENIVFYPITFEIINSRGEGRYFNGITPDVEVEDDLTKQFGDVSEKCLKEAIYYINNGAFSISSQNFRNAESLKMKLPNIPYRGIQNLVNRF
ncbi:MAG TPA: S41 family peptidase [Spirochaetota bacterium]|nr:S41 family peptidase [Spirochaetota bacterium]HOS34061.1 S41 family peptidase [Spirochaetota bacterium]HOS56955.1 S41 family peptidase [Spirochaetota bacterium]HPK60873.1 S41 family peptidase [Spirochaetota bacterium]HQF79128.1 S41 family peptidase [Spirochaetota bacterium]